MLGREQPQADHVADVVDQQWVGLWSFGSRTRRKERRGRLDEEIERHFAASGGTYGSPRITQNLRVEGWKLSENTVAKRMAELGLAGRGPKKPRSLTRQGQAAGRAGSGAPEVHRRPLPGRMPQARGGAVRWAGSDTRSATKPPVTFGRQMNEKRQASTALLRAAVVA